MKKWAVSAKHLTDDVIEKAFEGTNLGRTDYRDILAETVIQIAAGYECGFTAPAIAIGNEKKPVTIIAFNMALKRAAKGVTDKKISSKDASYCKIYRDIQGNE